MKTSELTGALLDYWVAKAEGWIETRSAYGEKPRLWDTGGGFYRIDGHAGEAGDERWRPSAYWAHGGPIIERERITICAPGFMLSGEWEAFIEPILDHRTQDIVGKFEGAGQTPLVAAMRAYVASKLGSEVS